jgi:hypothetical protein
MGLCSASRLTASCEKDHQPRAGFLRRSWGLSPPRERDSRPRLVIERVTDGLVRRNRRNHRRRRHPRAFGLRCGRHRGDCDDLAAIGEAPLQRPLGATRQVAAHRIEIKTRIDGGQPHGLAVEIARPGLVEPGDEGDCEENARTGHRKPAARFRLSGSPYRALHRVNLVTLPPAPGKVRTSVG